MYQASMVQRALLTDRLTGPFFGGPGILGQLMPETSVLLQLHPECMASMASQLLRLRGVDPKGKNLDQFVVGIEGRVLVMVASVNVGRSQYILQELSDDIEVDLTWQE